MSMSKSTAIVAICLDEGQFGAVLLNGGSPRQVQGPLSMDPLADEPALVAQELREQLAPLGRLPRQVVVALPLNRIMTTSIDIPAIADELVSDFLHLQAEQAFMLAPADMAFGASRARGSDRALLMALPMAHYLNLCRALRLMGWKRPIVTALPVTLAGGGEVGKLHASLLIGARWIDWLVCREEAIIQLRRVAGAMPDATRPQPEVAAVPGELRLSLGQLPAAVRRQLDQIVIVGARDAAARLRDDLRGVGPAGIEFTIEEAGRDGSLLTHAAEHAGRLARMGALALTLAPIPSAIKPRAWGHWNRRQLSWTAAILLLLAVGVAAQLLYQRRQLNALERSWRSMAPRTQVVRDILDEARAREAWLSDDPLTLDILRTVTMAFPEQGSVWTTRVEMRGRRQVSISGKALNREPWLKMLEDLRRSPGVTELRVSQARDGGDSRTPMTFALSFIWQRPAAEVTR